MSNSKLNCHRSIDELSGTGLEWHKKIQDRVRRIKKKTCLDGCNSNISRHTKKKKQMYGKTKEQTEKLAGHEK
jgi:hypothetical protein